MFRKTLITIRLFLYLCCFHKVYSYVTSGRSLDKRGRNVMGMGYGYKYHVYILAVEAGFYSDVGRVVGIFTKLNNVHQVEGSAPSFTDPLSATLPGSVDENSSKDMSILTVEGEDADGDRLSFSLISQTPTSPPFLLDASSGLLRTPTGLDAEYNLTYSFIFGVSDCCETVNSVTYIVNINDINEFTPVFQESTTSSVSVLDSVSNGYLVYDANATDADATATVTYSFISGNSPVTFALDLSNGKITVRDSTQLNSTSKPSYRLIIQASDETNTVNLTVSITVKGKDPSSAANSPTGWIVGLTIGLVCAWCVQV